MFLKFGILSKMNSYQLSFKDELEKPSFADLEDCFPARQFDHITDVIDPFAIKINATLANKPFSLAAG